MSMTPMMQQYLQIKSQHPDAIVFYRLGDFYEMFFEDAKTASRELELTLTGRDCGEKERAPMCGVPFHAADIYIGRLVSKGYKVVICEQMEDPATAKGLVKRSVIRTVTPGTVIDNTQLNDETNNYLCAICAAGEGIGFAVVDVSTGEMSATALEKDASFNRLINELATYSPKEVLLDLPEADLAEVCRFLRDRIKCQITPSQKDRFAYLHALSLVSRQFDKDTVDPAIVPNAVISAIGALLDYIAQTQLTDVGNVTSIRLYSEGQYLELDVATRRNLELTETMRAKEKKGTLLWVLDHTKTAMGARLLRSYLEMPLLNANRIGRRQRAVAELSSDYMLREELSECLKHVLDLDRLMSKLVYGSANARDLRAISSSLEVLPRIKELTASFRSEELSDIHLRLDLLEDVRDLIERAIVDEPPFSIRESGFIRRGFHPRADELYEIVHGGKAYIEALTEKEREKTGIKNLKIAYNRVFGYYIEVTRANLAQVPAHYIRKQTLSGSERFITQELKEKEAIILGASDKLSALEYELFLQVRQSVSEQIKRVQQVAARLAALDVYASLAEVAVRNHYCCPEIEYGSVISITEGRHPVVEQFVKDGYFVPNNTLLDTAHNRLALITGPNMAGKSTYMRQVALITLMAQIGSFVPAKEARIGIVDKIFTRVGASDDLASGQSTFMLEMNEVAYILKNATPRSLIIYDEIGRGTSTYDGMSIARAVAEYTAGKKLGAKTLFATHYHELTALEGTLPGVVNYNIAARKSGDTITFLRKIVRGATDDSYGIEVAKLAGIPNEIIRRARAILKETVAAGAPLPPERRLPEEGDNVTFDDYRANDVRERLMNTDVNLLTPLDALNLIHELKKLAQ